MAEYDSVAHDASTTIFDELPETDTFGGRLTRAREASGLTPAQLARRLAIKITTLQKWESDRSQPRANHLTMISGILGVSLSWLMHGVGSAPEEDLRHDLVKLVSGHLAQMKRMRDETSLVIDRLENELKRFDR